MRFRHMGQSRRYHFRSRADVPERGKRWIHGLLGQLR